MVSDEEYARINTMIDTMNKQHTHIVSKMREGCLLHETNLSLPFPRHEATLHDDCKSFVLLESNVVDDAPLIDLEEVFDPLLTSFAFVTSSFLSYLLTLV